MVLYPYSHTYLLFGTGFVIFSSSCWFRTLYTFCSRILVIRADIHKMLVKIAASKDSDQTASDEVYFSHNVPQQLRSNGDEA